MTATSQVPARAPRHGLRDTASGLVFFLALFLLCASGRLASSDAGNQLTAAYLMVTEGRLGTASLEHIDPGLWLQARDGRYYEVHDIGNLALMTPAVLLTHQLAKPEPPLPRTPPLLTRVAASMTISLLAALGCFAYFRLLRHWYGPRAGLLLALGFAAATFYLAYAKTAWDVTGASACVALAMSMAGRMADGRASSAWQGALFGLAIAAAGLFRYSLLPFLALGGGLLVLQLRSQLTPAFQVAAAAALGLGTLPSLLYNFVRTGNPLTPATVSARFAQTSDLQGSLVNGLVGLLVSPNKGLFLYAPVFLVLLALPLCWKRLPAAARRVSAAFLPAAMLYILMIAKLRWWGTFGWGPRYLVPVLPILFVPTAATLVALWPRWKVALGALVMLSGVLGVLPVLTNWSAAITPPGVSDQTAPRPEQQLAVARAFLSGLQGEPAAGDQPEALFPDLFVAQLISQGGRRAQAGWLVLALLLGALAVSGAHLVRGRRDMPGGPSHGPPA